MRLQAFAMAEGRLINDVAHEVVRDRLRFERDPDQAEPNQPGDPREFRERMLSGGRAAVQRVIGGTCFGCARRLAPFSAVNGRKS